MKVKRQAVIKQSFLKEKNAIGKFSKRDLNLIALALYWAEGTKTWDSKTEITNSDPKLLATFIRWMRAEGIAIERVKIALHLYVSMDVQHEITFWSTMLGIPQDQFLYSADQIIIESAPYWQKRTWNVPGYFLEIEDSMIGYMQVSSICLL